jgi:hypothetical protein
MDLAVGDEWEVKKVIERTEELFPTGNDHMVDEKR